MVDNPIQWYPGHIGKLERELQQILKQLDVVIELVDARIPYATWHQKLSQSVRQQKPVLFILNKADLADPTWTAVWVDYFKQFYPVVRFFDSSTGRGKKAIVDAICQLGEPKMQQQEAKGLKRRPLRVGVIGMPNVGKSSLINMLVGTEKGEDRSPGWRNPFHPMGSDSPSSGVAGYARLDTPKLDSEETGRLLASTYSIGDAAFDEEAIVPFFLERVEQLYPGTLQKMLDLAVEHPVSLETIAQRRYSVLPGGALDLKRTAQAVLKDYRHGKLGRLTLERPD